MTSVDLRRANLNLHGAAGPRDRPRRLRRTAALRDLVRETRLHPKMLIAPIFVRSGSGFREPIASLPGVDHVSPDEAVHRCMEIMTEKCIRHLPVVEKGKLIGIISIGDLVKAVIE